jgi:hypothetical protein
MNFEEVQAAHANAHCDLSDMESLIQEKKEVIREKYQALITAECDAVDREHRDALRTLRNTFGAALTALNQAKIERASQRGWKGHPPGTVLCRWETRNQWVRELVVKEKAIVEVCTQDSEFAGNIGRRRPSIGELFLRRLKKDGTPSLIVSGHYWGTWRPEGETLKEHEHANG